MQQRLVAKLSMLVHPLSPVLLGLLIRLGCWSMMSKNAFGDELSYFNHGILLSKTGTLNPFWPPFTIFFIAAVQSLFGDVPIYLLRLVWIVIDSVSIFLIYLLLSQFLPKNNKVAFFSALIYAMYVPAVGFSNSCTSEAVSVFIILLIALTLNSKIRSFYSISLISGLLTSLLILARSNLILLGIFFLPMAIFVSGHRKKIRESIVLKSVALSVFVTFVLPIYFSLSNLNSFGIFTINTATIHNFHIGNSQFYSEDLNLLDPFATKEQISDRQNVGYTENLGLLELKKEAIEYILNHPGLFFRRATGRLARIFAFKTDQLRILGGEKASGLLDVLPLILIGTGMLEWAVIAIFGAIGAAMLCRESIHLFRLVVSFVLSSALPCMVAISKPRYSFPFDWVLICLTVYAFCNWEDMKEEVKSPRVLLYVYLGFLFWAWGAWIIFSLSSRGLLS